MAKQRNRFVVFLTRTSLAALALALGVGIYAALTWTAPQPPELRPEVVRPRVRVMRTAEVAVAREWSGFGAARAMDSADVPARIASIVVEVPERVEPGERIRRGDLLIRLDAEDYEQQLERVVRTQREVDAQLEQIDIEKEAWRERVSIAETELEIAQRDLGRVRRLYEAGDAQEFELDQATQAVQAAQRVLTSAKEELQKVTPRRMRLEAQREALEADRRLAEINMERATVESPIDGVIEAVDVDVGERVNPGERVARVVGLDRIEVPIRLPSSARGAVQVGDDAVVRSAGAGGHEWSGRIARVSPADDESRTFAVYIVVEQDPLMPNLLAPGKYLEGLVRSSRTELATVVPRRVIEDDEVLLVRDGKLARRRVDVDFVVGQAYPDLGVQDERYWAVLREPLPAGELVVIDTGVESPPGAAVEAVIVNDTAVAGDGEGRSARERGGRSSS